LTIINPNTLFIGKNFIFLDACESTNTYALDVLNSKNIAEGTLICTNNQTKGRGQQGNSWISEPNQNLIFSLILMPKWLKPNQQFYLTKIISIVIVDLLNKEIQNGFEIKWPNDIYYQDKKVGGILIENTINKQTLQNSIIGVGLNVNQKSFSLPQATSLATIAGKNFDFQILLEKISQSFEAKYLQLKQNVKTLDRHYLDLLYKRGDISWYEDKDGRFQAELIGVTEIGKLVLKVKETLKTYDLKEIKFVN